MGGESDDCNFAIIQATIVSVDDSTVTFAARSTTASGAADLNLRRTFTVPLSEIYASAIPGAPPPVAMSPGATGNLYLSRTGWATRSTDGFTLFGTSTAIFKWPLCAGVSTPILTKLRVIPTSIVVRGHLQDEGVFHDVELLGPEAATSQDFTWNGADFIELRLSSHGARRLGAGAGESSVRMWPTRILVKGAPEIDPLLSGEVDILDCEMAGSLQHIAFEEPGAVVTLRLTQDGVNAFHVTPQLVAERSSSDDFEART